MNPDSGHVMLHAESIVHETEHIDPLRLVEDSHAAGSASGSTRSSSREEEGSVQEITMTADKELLALQVHAFLQASEDVEVDQEVIDDLIGVLTIDNEEEEADAITQENVDVHPADEDEQPPLSKQEIKQMLHLLKERGPSEFINEYVQTKSVPIVKILKAFGVELCPELRTLKPKTLFYILRVTLAHVLQNRDKLPQYNTIDDAVQLIRNAHRILILTGAGISVSCGIPDFRSKDGLYASLKNKAEYELDDPQQMFDIDYFRENPAVFYSIYPSNFTPSPCHRFIKLVEDQGKLLRNYTQNIDTLETQVGVEKVLQCHGSFATASCLQCRRKVSGKEIEVEILSQNVPLCPVCNAPDFGVAGDGTSKGKSKAAVKNAKKKKKKKTNNVWEEDDDEEDDIPEYPPGIMKPDITFFGEKLTDDFDHALEQDRFKVDLLLVIGTSLKVSPVAEILSHLPHSIPQVLINKTPINHINPDIILLGNADDIVIHLCEQLQWELPPPAPSNHLSVGGDARVNMKKRASADDEIMGVPLDPKRVGESHVWLFEGAEGGKWLQQLNRELGITPSKSVPPSAPGSGYNTRSSTPARSPMKISENGNASAKRETKKPRIA